VRRRHRLATFLDRVTAQNESGNRDFTRSGAPVTSSKGARFAMQTMPSTARDPGFGVTAARDSSPGEFNRVGREYRAALQQKYGGDLVKMWAAYNMGPNGLDAVLTKHGADWFNHIPQETRDYVRTNISTVRGQ
jgi:soluble lytic murein transglycosylase